MNHGLKVNGNVLEITLPDEIDIEKVVVNGQVFRSNQWILCSEKPPEDNIDVLICDREEDIYLSHMTRHKKFFDAYGDEIKGLIAWQPLPEPYIEVDDDA